MIELELPFPISINSYYKPIYNHKTKKCYITRSAAGKEYRRKVCSMFKGYPTLLSKLHVSLVLCQPSGHRRDIDNYDGKVIWDALTHAGIWKDDSQIISRYSEWGDNFPGGKAIMQITQS